MTKCIEELKKKSEGLSSANYKFTVIFFGLFGSGIGITVGLNGADTWVQTGSCALVGALVGIVLGAVVATSCWHCTWCCSCH